jgi:uncharacterized NAD(P)/FAD-binding protein YdhS
LAATAELWPPIRLLRVATPRPIRVVLFNRSGPFARGVAYGTNSPNQLLNVPSYMNPMRLSHSVRAQPVAKT